MLTFRAYYVTYQPQVGAAKTLRPGADAPPSYATVPLKTLVVLKYFIMKIIQCKCNIHGIYLVQKTNEQNECNHGRRKRINAPRRSLKILAKKVVFLVSGGKKQISPLLISSAKFWKTLLVAPMEKILPMPMNAIAFVDKMFFISKNTWFPLVKTLPLAFYL